MYVHKAKNNYFFSNMCWRNRKWLNLKHFLNGSWNSINIMSKGTFTNLFFGLKIEDLMKMVSMMGGQISLFLQWCFVGKNTKYDVK